MSRLIDQPDAVTPRATSRERKALIPPAECGGAALELIAASELPAAVQLDLVAHVDELVTRYDTWLTQRAGEWIARERAAC